MAFPYELMIGLRYTRAKRRNHFISFISLISMLGIALGVTALIVVLSVMNGFQTELRGRILAVVSHVQISGANSLDKTHGGVDAAAEGRAGVRVHQDRDRSMSVNGRGDGRCRGGGRAHQDRRSRR